MIKPDFKNTDEVLEWAAQLIEESDFSDLRGCASRTKRGREDFQVRFDAVQETRRSCAKLIRAFKNRPDLDAISILRDLAGVAGTPQQVLHLVDAWPLAWKGWLNIKATIKCNSNCAPPETEYSIELTDKGREVLRMSSQ